MSSPARSRVQLPRQVQETAGVRDDAQQQCESQRSLEQGNAASILGSLEAEIVHGYEKAAHQREIQQVSEGDYAAAKSLVVGQDRDGFVQPRARLIGWRESVEDFDDFFVPAEDEEEAEERGEHKGDDLVAGQARGKQAEGEEESTQ